MIPKLVNRLVVMIEQGRVAKATFSTGDETTNSMTNITVFPYFKLDTCRKKLKNNDILTITLYNYIGDISDL